MFIVMLALLLASGSGCAQRYVLRMSNPEQASTVTLFEGFDKSTEDDDRSTTLKDPAQIAKVAAFFKSKADEFYAFNTDPTLLSDCRVTFRNDMEVGDRFWLDPTHIYMKTPSGDFFACKLTPRESSDLVNIFRAASSAQSDE
jgi:hypothetical protein